VKRAAYAAIVAWALLLSGLLALPWLLRADNPGDYLIRNTIRLSLAYYATALSLMLFLRPAEWRGYERGIPARWCWTLAWAAYVIHVAMAFHFYHNWSHADAVRHTQEVSGFGAGIYFSHIFTLAWTADVAWWWLAPVAYAARPGWIGRILHVFMLFIAFNGTVVYETGPIRWAGAVVFMVLGVLWIYSRKIVAWPISEAQEAATP
jgi:hypothetical protein